MSIRNAQFWIVRASLLLIGATWVFFLLAPAIDFPLTFKESFALLKLITPVFMGYVGLAVGFLFAGGAPLPSPGRSIGSLLALLVRGPVILYGAVMICALIVFGMTNRSGANPAEMMPYDYLENATITATTILTGTTSVVASKIFRTG